MLIEAIATAPMRAAVRSRAYVVFAVSPIEATP
jgi:hypothetical protein